MFTKVTESNKAAAPRPADQRLSSTNRAFFFASFRPLSSSLMRWNVERLRLSLAQRYELRLRRQAPLSLTDRRHIDGTIFTFVLAWQFSGT